MRVVHICTTDIQGGAARAAYRLHNSLKTSGTESMMYVLHGSSTDKDVVLFDYLSHKDIWELRGIRRRIITHAFRKYRCRQSEVYEIFSDDRTPYTRSVRKQIPPCDIINLHWISGFIDYTSFFPQEKPIVWTLHDMNPFTGGCHYNNKCSRYLTGCGSCPQLGSSEEADLSRGIWLRKKKMFSRIDPSKLHFVTPSTWLSSEVKRSPIVNRFNVSVIPNCVETTIFKPCDKEFVRDLLALPVHAKIILFVADSISNIRKGFRFLAEALAQLSSQEEYVLVSIGRSPLIIKTSVPYIHLGSITNDRILALIYSAADVFVIPSIQDNLPNTVLESMACGTPVIGFSVGGIPDMVMHNINGLLVEHLNSKELCNAIEFLLNNDHVRNEMSMASIHSIEHGFTPQIQSEKYQELYNKITAVQNNSKS